MPEWRVGPTSMAIDATETLWEFYQSHRLPERGPREGGTSMD